MLLQDVDLIGTIEPKANSLRLFFSRRKISDKPESIFGLDKLFTGYPLITDKRLPIIQIDFKSYISYSITNESFTVWDDYEEFEGKAFRIYSKSRFLDYIGTHTIASSDYPGTIRHFGMVCLDHIVNIASNVHPMTIEVRR